MNAQALVQTQQQGPVLVVSINNPPVNALGQGVRAGLLAAVEQLEQDAALKAMLIVGQGKAFIAGADIREFGKPPMAPALPDVLNRMETGSKLVVAAIHGPALGGGLEVAMATHFRVALAGAKLGLPEVNLGLLPGAGGTQRSPRLMGVKAATELMLSGQHLSAKAALAAGLVDKLAEGDDPLVAGLAYVNELLARGVPPRRTRDLAIADKAAALAELDAIALESVKKTRGLFSPAKIIECVRAAVELPFEQGLKRERELFLECLNSPQRQGLVHAFFAERETAKIPEAKAAAPRALASIAVIGGGTMGAGITVSALDAGLSVVMVERDAESIARGQKNVEKVYDGLIARGRMTAEAKAATMARYTPSTSYDAIKHVDLVIEAVFEDIEVKKAVFKELDRVCKSGAVLATNTSYLDIDAIAAVTSRPQDVIGLHFFSPANIMK
ncbi:MAG TPA: 3-hydroxyacyl-CoA dehydrogenase NAD-binding domain-containing protein, partial [Alicycliphilus sp.]|nr:3-hydroxyacyl-CoA dehydrogenase NAD-binding domain-containing protein [Alicycliphilus sp.]